MASVVLGLLAAAGAAQAEITWSGALRNDVLVWNSADRTQVFDLLENQIVMQRNAQDWKFYSDVRVDIFGGDLGGLVPGGATLSSNNMYQVRILRGFIRYFTGRCDVTVGKTYVNLGVTGLFNPFELDRAYNVTDLTYTKDGVLAATWEISLDELSGVKTYFLPVAGQGQVAGGAEVDIHVGTFDTGAVIQRVGPGDNVVGVFAKGDIEIGVQGALAVHLNNEARAKFAQAMLGADYSFGEGKWIVTVQGYYNGDGQDTIILGVTPELAAGGSAFLSRYYGYADLLHVPDEFFQVRLSALVNGTDGSALVIPSATWVLADGLSLNLQALVPTGAGNTQYSRGSLGNVIGVARVEAKL